jgi:DNA-directed RNA polymerase specialized sigma24 family protein
MGCHVAAVPDAPGDGPRGCSEPERFAAFYKEFRGVVFRTILARLMDTAVAEDVTAEAFARAYAHWDDTVAEHPNQRAWVLKVAWNHYLSSWRGWEARLAPDRPVPSWPAPPPPIDPRVAKAIRSLPRGQRDVLVLAALGDMTLTEIAEVLGKAPGTVRAQLYRARARLRPALGQAPGHGGRDA